MFGVSNAIVSDEGKHFSDKKFDMLCCLSMVASTGYFAISSIGQWASRVGQSRIETHPEEDCKQIKKGFDKQT